MSLPAALDDPTAAASAAWPATGTLRLLLVEAAGSALPPRMARALVLRYGLEDGGRYRTLAQVGQALGVSRERARQLTTTGLERLRRRGRWELARGSSAGACGRLVAQAEALAGDLEGAALPARLLEHLWAELRFLPPRHGARLLLVLAGVPWPQTAAAAARVEQVLQDLLRARAGDRLSQEERLRRARFERFLEDGTIWFGPPRLVRRLGGFQAARRVQPEFAVAHHSPKLGRDVACESGLERRFYGLLDQAEGVWFYQEQPVAIPLAPDGPRCYHPDVLVVLADGRAVLAELKPRRQWALFGNLVKWAALAGYCRRAGYGMFVGDCGRALQRALLASPPEPLAEELCALAERGTASWSACRRLLRAHAATVSDLNAVVLAHGLELDADPFILRRLSGPDGQAVREFVGLLRAGLRANADQARLAARLRTTEQPPSLFPHGQVE